MSGLDKILAKILADAKAAGENVISEAQKSAEEILAADAAEAAAQIEKRAAKAEAEANALADRSHSAAKLQTRKTLLQERNRIIDEVLGDVAESVLSMPDADYFSMLTRFVVSHAQNESGQLVLNERDLARLPDGFAASLSAGLPMPLAVSPTPGTFNAGCILVYGEVEYNGTLDALIYEKKDELRDLLNKELFAE